MSLATDSARQAGRFPRQATPHERHRRSDQVRHKQRAANQRATVLDQGTAELLTAARMTKMPPVVSPLLIPFVVSRFAMKRRFYSVAIVLLLPACNYVEQAKQAASGPAPAAQPATPAPVAEPAAAPEPTPQPTPEPTPEP